MAYEKSGLEIGNQDGFCFTELQFYIGTEIPDFAPGQRPWKVTFPDGDPLEYPETYTFEIGIGAGDQPEFTGFDLEEGVDYYVAFHVSTCDGQTGMGWDGGENGGFFSEGNGSWKRFTRWNWNGGDPGGEWICGNETAWAFGEGDFEDEGFNRWGWYF
ncbi:MAG: hypothetical protein HRF49_11965 [bacterium]|jgi:hypothetical protein